MRKLNIKSDKGITLTALIIYILIATIVIAGMSMISLRFISNINLIKNESQYVVEFNKFNMFFIQDIKRNKTAEVTNTQITLEDETIYRYDQTEKAIYRNDTKIAKDIQSVTFLGDTYTVSNTVKNLVKVNISIGKKKTYNKQIEYVLKYW